METICHQKKLNEPKVFFQKPKEKTIEKHEKNTTDAEPTPQKIPGKHFQKSPVFDRKSNHLSPCCTFKADPADPWCFPWYFLFSCLEYPQRKTATPQKNVGVWNISVQNCPKKTRFPSWSFQQSSEKSSNWNIFPKWGWKKNMFETTTGQSIYGIWIWSPIWSFKSSYSPYRLQGLIFEQTFFPPYEEKHPWYIIRGRGGCWDMYQVRGKHVDISRRYKS